MWHPAFQLHEIMVAIHFETFVWFPRTQQTGWFKRIAGSHTVFYITGSQHKAQEGVEFLSKHSLVWVKDFKRIITSNECLKTSPLNWKKTDMYKVGKGGRSSDILFETGSNGCYGRYGLYLRSTSTNSFNYIEKHIFTSSHRTDIQ